MWDEHSRGSQQADQATTERLQSESVTDPQLTRTLTLGCHTPLHLSPLFSEEKKNDMDLGI